MEGVQAPMQESLAGQEWVHNPGQQRPFVWLLLGPLRKALLPVQALGILRGSVGSGCSFQVSPS